MSDRKKRLRNPIAKEGELKAAWGRVDREDQPSLVYVWGAGTDMRSASRVLCDAMEQKPLAYSFPDMKIEERPSLIEELEARGFDITTLRFFIKKKDQPHV